MDDQSEAAGPDKVPVDAHEPRLFVTVYRELLDGALDPIIDIPVPDEPTAVHAGKAAAEEFAGSVVREESEDEEGVPHSTILHSYGDTP